MKQKRREIVEWYLPRIKAETGPAQDRISEKIRAKGGTVNYRYTIFNGVSARVPPPFIRDLASDPEVEAVVEDRRGTALLDVSVPTIGAIAFWNAGYFGGGYNAGILDTGMDTAHPAFAGKSIIPGIFLAAGQTDPCYADDAGTVDDKQGHGTHVAGIVMSQGSPGWDAYQGVAKGLNKTLALKTDFRCSDGTGKFYTSDVLAGIDWGLHSSPNPADAFNFSAGYPTDQDDDSFAQQIDSAVDLSGVPIVVGAGNYNAAVSQSRYVFSPGIAYNVITVANADDKGTTDRSDDTIAANSSLGPTAGGRKKPDLTAPGTSIYSANYDWEGNLGLNPDFVAKTGTSMAAPHVTGATLLLRPFSGSLLATKAVLINTAEDRGDPGWDPAWGWGYIDLGRAFNHRYDYTWNYVYPTTPSALYRVAVSPPSASVKATLVWNRHPGFTFGCPGPPYQTLNDLDLYLYDESNGNLLDSSVSTVDNVEQVEGSASSGAVLRVHAYCADWGGLYSEKYALAYMGGLNYSRVYTDLNVWVPNETLAPGQQFTVSVSTAVYSVVLHDASLTLTVPAGFSIVSGANPQDLGSICWNCTGTATWTVAAPTAPGAYSATATAHSSSYGEEFSGASTATWTVTSNPPSATTLFASPVGGTSATLNGEVNPNGSDTSAWFEYGTDSLLNAYQRTPSQPVGSGSSAQQVSYAQTGLTSNTRYYYRIVASSAGGTVRGTIVSFTTFSSAVTLTPASLMFTGQKVGTTSSGKVVNVVNTGGAPATLYGINESGGNSLDFGRTHNCSLSPSTLPAGGSCQITVTFTPTGVGPRKSSVVVTDNAAGNPHALVLTGLGTQ
jgi:subtilisin family serine protease